MKKYRYLLWDLDGTLTLSHPGIFNCMRYALEKLGKPEPTMEQLRLCVGPPLNWSFETVFGCTYEEGQKAIQYYRERYEVAGWAENEPLEGAYECLKALHAAGYKMALATSKPMHYAVRIIEKFGFSDFLVYEYEPVRPGYEPKKTDMIERGMAQLGASKEECLMIGDRQYDVIGARTVGVDVAALDVGYAEKGEFDKYPPDYYFADFASFTKALLK